MRVGEVMTTTVHTIAASESAAAAWEQMHLHAVHHLVVVDSGRRPRGIVTDADLGGRHGAEHRERFRVADLMTEKPIAAAPTTTIREAANLMRGHDVSCLPVLERGRLVGIVTAIDLLELVGRGAERPVVRASRAILKNRGEKPHGTTRAKRVHRTRLEKTSGGRP